MLYPDWSDFCKLLEIKYSLGMRNIINYIIDQVIAIIRKKIETTLIVQSLLLIKKLIFLLQFCIFTFSLTASRDLDRSIKRFTIRLHARSWVCLYTYSSCVQVTHTPTDEMVCGTSKVHVVVDHGSGNSRLPTVVQVCMNVGHHLYRPQPLPPRRREKS